MDVERYTRGLRKVICITNEYGGEMIHPLGEAISLSKFYDQSSGQYFALELPEDPGFQAVLADAKRRHVELSSRIAVVDSGLMLDHPLIKRNLIKL